MRYEILLQEATSDNLYIIENANFKSDADALINGDVIGLNKNIQSFTERFCVLAEELGHYYTTVGNILNQSEEYNRKQEARARRWAYDATVGLDGIILAYRKGCCSIYEMAEELEVTVRFLSDMLEIYSSKYGTSVKYGDYLIEFVPTLNVKIS